MEPQLRQPGGSGTGTPFTPFAVEQAAAKAAAEAAVEAVVEAVAEEVTGASPTAEGSGDTADTSRPADFRKGARRSHRSDPPAVKPAK
jgi:hypothetical protein